MEGSDQTTSAARTSSRLGRVLLFVLAALVAPMLFLALAWKGFDDLGTARQARDEETPRRLACAQRWVDLLPAGATFYQPHAGATGDALFWVQVLNDAAFPRVRPVQTRSEAEFNLQVAPAAAPVDGIEPCAGFKLRFERNDAPVNGVGGCGRVSGDQPPTTAASLPPSGSLRDLLAEMIEVGPLDAGSASDQTVQEVCDDSGAIGTVVPTAWSAGTDQAGTIVASTDIAGPIADNPVLTITATPSLDQSADLRVLLDGLAQGTLGTGQRSPREGTAVADACRAFETVDYADDQFSGAARIYGPCEGQPRAWLMMVLYPRDGGHYRVDVIAQALTTADAAAIGQAVEHTSVDEARLPAF